VTQRVKHRSTVWFSSIKVMKQPPTVKIMLHVTILRFNKRWYIELKKNTGSIDYSLSYLMMIRCGDCNYSFSVFIKDPYSLHKNHNSEMGCISIFRCRCMKQSLLSFFHVNMKHRRHCVAYLPLKMKMELYFCNVVAFIYRSRMLDEVQKCLNHWKKT
jgi:hypothetical protein